MVENELTEPVYWRGTQWAITAYGFETIAAPYHYYFPWEKVWELRNDGGVLVLGALEHLLDKGWSDIDELGEAFRQAATLRPDFPTGIDLNAAIDRAMQRERASRKREAAIERFLPAGEIYTAADYEMAVARAREAGLI